MAHPGRHQRGYSLIEMLVVLAIVAILAIAGVSYLGNRPAVGVRQVLDELEGALLDAQKVAIATGRDVTLATTGTWSAATPLVLVRGDATIATGDWSAALTAAQAGTFPPVIGGMTSAQYNSLGLGFRVATAGAGLGREHLNAGIDTSASQDWWTLARGTSTNINSVVPFSAPSNWQNELTGSRLLFNGAPNTALSISGTSKRFNQTFWIPVVSLRNGNPLPGGPMGLIMVRDNGGTVYKFYNPGMLQGDGQWRRI